jgi:hypothetical protein
MNVRSVCVGAAVVDKLIQAARDYLAANRRHVTNVRIMSIRRDQILSLFGSD